MTKEELQKLIQTKRIQDLDLSLTNVDGLDFSDCHLKNVTFTSEASKGKEIIGTNFKNATLESVSFDHATLRKCNFDQTSPSDQPSISKVSFRDCQLLHCRFRHAHFSWTDFRYAEINGATFEEAILSFCDFYRAFLLGIIIFRKSRISNCSLFYTYFEEGATIRRDNLVNGRIIQQDKEAYLNFLVDWNQMGTGERKNDRNAEKSDWSPQKSMRARFEDAEDIYKGLNGLWMSRGFYADANWAYVQGRRAERQRMIADLMHKPSGLLSKVNLSLGILWSFISDIMFGYGESIGKMVLSYFIIIFLFAFFYYASSEVDIGTYSYATVISLKNMVAISSTEVEGVSPLVDLLNVLQTTLGILITGIFGFILGNKIRNQ
ncbi:MAG: pentapeptide repeat-containing protein [Vicingaceae bacterium]